MSEPDQIPIANPDIGPDEEQRISEVLHSGMLADGPTVREFESDFASYCGAKHGVATSNGTTALHTAFEALGLGRGDRILTTPFSFIASANAIRLCGAEPVFVDINEQTYNLDPAAVSRTIENADEELDAILAVHLYGLPADLKQLSEIAEQHNLLLVEDAAQAHGATIDGTRVGAVGDAACFSFYPTKNMTTGEGGMVTTSDEQVAERAARFVNHGRSDTYAHVEVGHNFRMTSIAAAIGNAQLEKLPQYIETRRKNASRLTQELSGLPITTPVEPADRTHVYHQYTIRTSERDSLKQHLEEHGIGYGVYYPIPIHKQQAYEDITASVPVAERATEEVISLPIHPSLSDHDINRIIECVRDYF